MSRVVFYIIAFFTGGALLSFELFTTRLLDPYFGHSFIVWSATIGTTMGGILMGYFLAQKLIGWYSNLKRVIFIKLIILGVVIFALPFYSDLLLTTLVNVNIHIGILVSTVLINLPLFTLISAFTPVIIQVVTGEVEKTGMVSGVIYGLSTFGGVFLMLVSGILLLPNIGLQFSVFSFSLVLICLAAVLFLFKRKSIYSNV